MSGERAVPPTDPVDDEARKRSARLVLAAAVLVFVVAMLLQLSGDAYLRGDGTFYLRDAARLADGHLPQSRYSPGFALLLSPLLLVLGDNYAAAGDVTIVFNMVVAVLAFGLLYRFLRTWLEPVLAATTVAVFALSQGVVTYFAEVRPEALCLLILTGMVLALKGGRPGLAVVLGGAAMLVRIALAPLVLVTLAISLRRRPWLLAAAAALFAVAAVAYLVTQSPAEQSYLEVGGNAYSANVAAWDRLEDLARTASLGVVHYLQYGLPRLALPFRVLSSGLGPVVGGAMTAAMVAGVVVLLVQGSVRRALLSATVIGFAVYLIALLAWPIRPLSAVRLITPAPAVPMLGLATAVVWASARLLPSRTSDAAVAVMGLIALVGAVGSASAVSDHINDGKRDRRELVMVYAAVRDSLPPGRLMSSAPGASELLTRRRAVGYPIRRDLDDYAGQLGVCAAVLSPETPPDAAAWIRRYRSRTLAAAGRTEVVTVARPWCPEGT